MITKVVFYDSEFSAYGKDSCLPGPIKEMILNLTGQDDRGFDLA
jgi:hypothetical protein